MPDSSHRAARALRHSFSDVSLLVVGDVMLDRYVRGDVNRISPEAPVAVLDEEDRTEVVGGAGNVAMNARGLGASVDLVGVVGHDSSGTTVRDTLDRAGVSTQGLLVVDDRPTTLKTRAVAGSQHVVRIDRETRAPLSDADRATVIDSVTDRLSSADALVLSDYAKGVLDRRTCHALIDRCREAGLPCIVDPKSDRFDKYRGADTVCPNASELAAATDASSDASPDALSDASPDASPDVSSDGWEELAAAGLDLCHSCDIRQILVTRGADGMTLLRPDAVRDFPTRSRDLYDVSGAGDTVVATFAVAVASGADEENAVCLANVAGGWAVEHVGTSVVTREQLTDDLDASGHPSSYPSALRLSGPSDLIRQRRQWRADGDTVVFTNGCFDLLHVGHVHCLAAAKQFGDWLVVALNSDESVRVLKGPDRPFVPEEERARIVASLDPVDAVVLFDAETPIDLIRALQPDVLVKGDDYKPDEIAGAKVVQESGGRVETVPLVEGKSTTDLAQRIASYL